MDIGRYAVDFGLFAAVVAIVLYIVSHWGNRKLLLGARAAFFTAAICVVMSFLRLMWLVYHQRYDVKYVFEYSSPDLQFPWTIAATWAGQEGSFLLWAFWTSIIGGMIALKAGKWENRVMPIYTTVLVFLLGILAWLSPFVIQTRASLAGYPPEFPWPPTFGRGLHPSLQNIWMAIHPPTIFFGFASLAVPFCYAIAAMLWREYESWAPRVMPYVLMTVGTLGVGLFMGGYWAYETQGWHGFWGWDPVENASLFPWLGALGLLHGLVVQKSRGGMGRTNIFLAIMAWLAFLWGTYLTRSGVLSNFSVHSFVSLASQPLDLIKLMIGGYGAVGLVLLIINWKKIPGKPISDSALSRDTAMVLAVSLMMATALVVGIATSWPLISRLSFVKVIPILSKYYAAGGLAAQPIFYNRLSSVILIPTLLALGSVPFLAWHKTNGEKFLSRAILPWIMAVACGFGVVYFTLSEASSGFNPEPPGTPGFIPGTPRMLVVAIATLGLFAAFSNIMLAYKVLRTRGRITMGGWLAHVGIGLLIFGTVITNVYEKTDSVVVIEGEPAAETKFGYSLEYAGWSSDPTQKLLDEATDPTEQDKLKRKLGEEWRHSDHALKLKVTNLRAGQGIVHADDGSKSVTPSGDSFMVEARVFFNNMKLADDKQSEFMTWPYIHQEAFRDVYVTCANDPKQCRPATIITPGESRPITYLYDNMVVMPTKYTVKYNRFFMEGQPGMKGTVMRAELEVTSPDGRTAIVTPGLRIGGPNGPESVVALIPGMQGAVTLKTTMNVSNKQIHPEFEFPDASTRWIIPMQVTNKPLINFVWLGVLVMGTGIFVAMIRRSLENRKGLVMESATNG
ncbi:MAG: cytochrome c biogenesis protein CcsA [Chthonomonadales bacterium]